MRTLTWAGVGLLLGAIVGFCGSAMIYFANAGSEMGNYVSLAGFTLVGTVTGAAICCGLGAAASVAFSAQDDARSEKDA